MAATTRVYTIRLAARTLGRDEDLPWNLADHLESEDGMLWIYDVDSVEILAFTDVDLKTLREIIRDQIDQPG
ncbi:MAG: hypothetical protein WCI21_01185 [Alphaproteobacteria bacterium]